MTANAVRLAAIREISANEAPAPFFDAAEKTGAIFGENVFSLSVMQKRLPKSVYSALLAGSERGTSYDDNTRAFGCEPPCDRLTDAAG